MKTSAAEHDITPVLPRRYRSFFFLLAGLLGLQVYVTLLPVSVARLMLEGEMGLSAGDQRLMLLLICCAAMALVRDGSTQLCARVSLALSALGVTAPLYASYLPVEAGGLRGLFLLTVCFALPAMLQAGPKKTMMRRLTFGVALTLLVETLLQLATWLVGWLVMQGELWLGVSGGRWQPYVAVVVALPVLVRLLFLVQRRPLPDLTALDADWEETHPVGDAAPAELSVQRDGGRRGLPAGSSVSSVPGARMEGKMNRLSALMVLTLGVVGAFVWGGDDPSLEVARRGSAWALVLLYVIWYAPCLLIVMRETLFWLAFVLLMLMHLPEVCQGIMPVPTRFTPLLVLEPMVGCFLGCWLMRRLNPGRVALVCFLFVLVLSGMLYGSILALDTGTLSLDDSVWVKYWLAGMRFVVEVYGLVVAAMAVAFCGLVTWGVGKFSARLGGLAMGVLLALLSCAFV